jgi:hypothetical protein
MPVPPPRFGYDAGQAGDEDRTRIIALEGRGSTIELPPRARTRSKRGSLSVTVCTNYVDGGDLVERPNSVTRPGP